MRRVSGLAVFFAIFCSLASASAPVWAAQGEMGLDEALERFYRCNYDIIVAKFEIDKSYADFVTAKLLPNPNLTSNYIGLNAGGGQAFSTTSNSQVSVRLDQLILTAGKRGLRTRSAEESFDAAKFTRGDVIRNLLIGFYSTFYTVNLDKLDLDLAKDELKRFDRILEVGKKKHDAGALSEIDYTKLDLARIDLENGLITARSQYADDLEQFGVLLGSDEPVEGIRVEVGEELPRLEEEGLVARGFRNRYDLLSLEKQKEAAKYDLSLARATSIPDITPGVEYDAWGPGYKPAIGFGISVALPLFDRNQGDILKKSAVREQIDVLIDKAKRQIVSDVRRGLIDYRASIETFDVYRQKRTDVERLLANSERAFSLGGITVLDLIDTEKTHTGFLRDYNKALVKANLNRELMKLYTGEMR